ncbi:30S ribosomal protein S1 [SAR86 cluster bacterium]|nr:30S ribosomal protein S1 [SAR86 cluster bacterium]
MSENFAELLDDNLKSIEMRPGTIVSGVVLAVDKDWVTVHVGLKSEGVISLDEFKDVRGEAQINVGDEVEVALEAVEDGYGETRISREKARKIVAWKKLEEALETGEFVTGKVLSRVKGGFSVEVDVIKAFLPGSLVDVRPMKEVPDLENNIEDFKVIKLDYKRNNVVLSRKAVLEQKNSAEKVELLKNLEEGQIVKGIVKNITDYGAFIDLGGLDGLLHITDISWSRVINPKDALNLGEEIEVKVLNFDKEKARVSLGLKQIQNDPWEGIEGRYSMGGIYEAKVSNITDYGCFAELEQGVEGLIHLSELDWTNKNIHPSKVVNLDEKIRVMILEMDNEKRRISLGLKQTKPNPWIEFENKYNIGDSVNGQIKSITDFGVFVGLDGDIDGLIHASDLSDDNEDETPDFSEYKKGEDISCIIFGIDAERERISLKLSE